MKTNKMVYVVNGVEEISTLKELGEMLGKKVTKKQVLAGEVEGVEYKESILEEVASTEEDSMEDQDLIDDINSALEDTVEEEVEETVEDTVEEADNTEEVEETVEPVEEIVEPKVEEAVEEADSTEEAVEEAPKASNIDTSNLTLAEKIKLISKPAQAKKAPKKPDKLPVDAEVNFPEVGQFSTKEELKDFYKQLQDVHLDQWIELEGLTWKESGNPGIDRMRRCMAITALHFPSKSKSKKSKSKYAQYTTEALVEMCLDNDVEIPEAKGNDAKILRMYAIVALRKAGIIE